MSVCKKITNAHTAPIMSMWPFIARDILAVVLWYLIMGIFTVIVIMGLRARMGEYADCSWGMVAKVAVAHVVGWPYVWWNT